jgi:hypothetical protein
MLRLYAPELGLFYRHVFAIAWAGANNRISNHTLVPDRVCWPRAYGRGRTYSRIVLPSGFFT